MENPVKEYNSLQEAEKALGYPVLVPAVMTNSVKKINVIDGKILDLTLSNNLRYRMAKGTNDISGDWTKYPEVKKTTIGNYHVTEKGMYGRVFLLLWTDGEFTFSATTPYGFPQNTCEEIVSSMGTSDTIGLPSPMVHYDYVFEAEYAVGFAVNVPTCIKASNEIYVIGGDVVEILYENDMVYRIAKGVSDISGVYQTFEKQKAFQVGRFHVLAKGSGELYYLTLWNDGKLSYSLYAKNGMEREKIEEFIDSLRQVN